MKTWLEIPDDLFKRAKATAALQGERFEDLLRVALEAYLESQAIESSPQFGWRSVFGKANPEDVAAVDVEIREAFGRVDLDHWR